MEREEVPGGRIHEAMRYSLLAGGKRLRPLLVLAAGRYLGIRRGALRAWALAVEYLHTYSLIHDDLPAMDDDDFRRGVPTSHRVFGEALAILAGDALLTEAFLCLAREGAVEFAPERVLAAMRVLAEAAGSRGLIAGQVADLGADLHTADLGLLESIHRRKTATLITAAVAMPAVLVGETQAQERLEQFGEHFGLAFQIVDDILNVVGDPRQMGKAQGTDAARGKVTYPALIGLDESRRWVQYHRDRALQALQGHPRADALALLLEQAVERER
ncbi:MAG: polyprenyl synthetase family protein [Firmicutes bacterium]|nr:polyprenyl synthetase family protein [Alicyclobacillaceae bacterium]MCL6496680.1 polyprenyl synthetase family protein [Bacillota bacterium]